MRNVLVLLYIQFTQLQLVSKFKQTSTGKKIGMLVFAVFAVLGYLPLFFSVSFSLSLALSQVGLSTSIPAVAVAITSIFLFFLAMRQSTLIFSARDWNLLGSLPIPTWQIVCSKLLFLYILLFGTNTIVMVPQIIFLQTNTTLNLSLPLLILLFLTTPLIPFVLGTGFNVAISAFTRRFRHLNNKHVYGIIGLIPAFFLITNIFNISNIVRDHGFEAAAKQIATILTSLAAGYPPSWLLMPELIPSFILGACLFLALSLGVFSAFTSYVGKHYIKLNARTIKKDTVVKVRKAKQYTPLQAALRREFQLLTQFPKMIWSFAITYVLLLVVCVMMWIGNLDQISAVLTLPDTLIIAEPYQPLAYAFGLGFFLMMLSAYASSAFSMEGKNVWIIQTLPLSFRSILQIKLLVSAIIMLPAIPMFIISVLVNQLLPLGTVLSITCWAVCYTIFLSLSDLLVNFLLPSYNWKSENDVHTMSAAALVGSFGHMFFFGILILISVQNIAQALFIQIIGFVIVSTTIFVWLTRQKLHLKNKT